MVPVILHMNYKTVHHTIIELTSWNSVVMATIEKTIGVTNTEVRHGTFLVGPIFSSGTIHTMLNEFERDHEI